MTLKFHLFAIFALLFLSINANAYLTFRLTCANPDAAVVVSVDKITPFDQSVENSAQYNVQWTVMLNGFDRDFSSPIETKSKKYENDSYLEGFQVADGDARLTIHRLGKREAFSADIDLLGQVFKNIYCQRSW